MGYTESWGYSVTSQQYKVWAPSGGILSMLWNVPSKTIKFFLNGTPTAEVNSGQLITTVIDGTYYIGILDGDSAGSGNQISSYIKTNPAYWTYDPEVLDQL